MERDKQLLAIRPSLVIDIAENDTDIARFMHQTLRPVLKFQHQLICTLINKNKFIKQLNLNVNDALIRRNNLKAFIIKQKHLKTSLISVAVAIFTSKELEIYMQHKKEIEKRIIDMVITRFLSTY